ncbi:hypothetical protein A4A49_06120 [Nicotiana attenuata]|uniref:Zinc knuckle CX2CX4HX4C domain-containing protein n=1 Tax=Nicotiana attenuata TaxID=49451 RepID=A0A314KWB0_NICAT|nr:hypothetical protein A4A49_06120 [Nicotiana attenuata]
MYQEFYSAKMAEEITKRLHKFILTEEEKEVVAIEFPDIQASMKECEVSLLGKVISDEKFIFKDKKSLDKVKLGTPWLYDRYLLNIHTWEPGLESDSPIFNESNIWVQVWNIPLHRMSRDVGRKIGHALGGIIDILIPEYGSKEGQYMRLKVKINITKPLLRGKWIKLGLETIQVELRYENLPYVCYYCGVLGHNDKTCIQREQDFRSGNLRSDQFGTWLRAENNASFSESQKRQDFNNDRAGHTMMRNCNYKLIEVKRATETREDLKHMEDDGDSMDTQDGIEKENVQVHSLEDETIQIYNNSLPLAHSQNKDTGQLHTNTLQKTKLPVYSYSQSLLKRQGDIARDLHDATIIPGKGLVVDVCIHEFEKEDKEQDGIEKTMVQKQDKDDEHNGVKVSDVVSGNEAVNLEEPNILIDILIMEEFGLMGVKRKDKEIVTPITIAKCQKKEVVREASLEWSPLMK